MRAALRLVVASQAVYFGCLAIDVGIRPGYLFSTNEGGVSNFGVHAVTAGPFTAGFAGCALLLFAAATRVPTGQGSEPRRAALWAVGAALLAAMATTYPYQHGPALHALHLAVGAVAMATEVVVAIGLARLGRTKADVAAAGVVVAGGVLAVLASAGVLRVLFVAQLLESAGLCPLLCRVVPWPADVAPAPPRATDGLPAAG